MTIREFYRDFSSDTVAGSANQVLTRFSVPAEHRGRVSYRLSHGGEHYAFLFSNIVDSTYADGSISRANDVGGTWKILSVRVGLTDAWDGEPAQWHTVTFDGARTKTVSGAATFTTDPVALHAEAGDYLCYEIALFGACFPYHEEMILNVRKYAQDGTLVPDKKIPVPLMIGCDRPVSKRVGFLGDSITQGIGTAYESYAHWAARIAEKLDPSISVWDLGIGFARCSDAATDGAWLARAKTCDVVNICLGVNDMHHDFRGKEAAETLICGLRTIVEKLNEAGCRTILFTIPPFDYGEDMRAVWQETNRAIRGALGKEAAAVFDFALPLGKPAPMEHMAKYGGHPNAEGCLVVAEAYLAQFGTR